MRLEQRSSTFSLQGIPSCLNFLVLRAPSRDVIHFDLTEYTQITIVQTSYEVHPASYPMDTGVLSPGLKSGRGVTLTLHPHLVPRSTIRIYIFPPPPLVTYMAVAGHLYFLTNQHIDRTYKHVFTPMWE
jgi:hypothetical protein